MSRSGVKVSYRNTTNTLTLYEAFWFREGELQYFQSNNWMDFRNQLYKQFNKRERESNHHFVTFACSELDKLSWYECDAKLNYTFIHENCVPGAFILFRALKEGS